MIETNLIFDLERIEENALFTENEFWSFNG